jgi:Flp pilus assembly protein TadG
MNRLFKINRGATMVEFALVALPVILFITGIIQIAYVIWADNLLHLSVETAARCGAVRSTTSPCNGSNMVSAATTVFAPLSGASFTSNSTCSTDGGTGLVGPYTVRVLFVNLTLTANACYPVVPS